LKNKKTECRFCPTDPTVLARPTGRFGPRGTGAVCVTCEGRTITGAHDGAAGKQRRWRGSVWAAKWTRRRGGVCQRGTRRRRGPGRRQDPVAVTSGRAALGRGFDIGDMAPLTCGPRHSAKRSNPFKSVNAIQMDLNSNQTHSNSFDPNRTFPYL
jgi:hypothetical protein